MYCALNEKKKMMQNFACRISTAWMSKCCRVNKKFMFKWNYEWVYSRLSCFNHKFIYSASKNSYKVLVGNKWNMNLTRRTQLKAKMNEWRMKCLDISCMLNDRHMQNVVPFQPTKTSEMKFIENFTGACVLLLLLLLLYWCIKERDAHSHIGNYTTILHHKLD